MEIRPRRRRLPARPCRTAMCCAIADPACQTGGRRTTSNSMFRLARRDARRSWRTGASLNDAETKASCSGAPHRDDRHLAHTDARASDRRLDERISVMRLLNESIFKVRQYPHQHRRVPLFHAGSIANPLAPVCNYIAAPADFPAGRYGSGTGRTAVSTRCQLAPICFGHQRGQETRIELFHCRPEELKSRVRPEVWFGGERWITWYSTCFRKHPLLPHPATVRRTPSQSSAGRIPHLSNCGCMTAGVPVEPAGVRQWSTGRLRHREPGATRRADGR